MILGMHLMVSNLFLPGTRSWNVALLNDIFTVSDVHYIQSIPCSFGEVPTHVFSTVVLMGFILLRQDIILLHNL